MRLAFCELPILRSWTLSRVATKTGRRLASAERDAIEATVGRLAALQRQGLKLACMVQSAGVVITDFYKGGLPLEGETHPFPIRKSFAREAATLLQQNVEFLPLDIDHFRRGQILWEAYCDHGMKNAYAQFMDYMTPP